MATSDHHQTDLTGSSHSHDDHHISRSNKYKGVRKRKWGKWVSEIRLPNSRERIWLGSYDTAEKAARAFDAALYCLRGRHAHFNFPDTPLELEIDVASPAPAHAHAYQSLSPQQIQEIASRFANQHHDDQNHHHHHHQLDPPLLQQSSSSEPAESDGVRETESGGHNMYDWSFLNSLDSSIDEVNFSSSNDNDRTNDLYSGLHKMHSGELYPASPPPLLMDHIGDANINEGDDALCQQSLFLWNF